MSNEIKKLIETVDHLIVTLHTNHDKEMEDLKKLGHLIDELREVDMSVEEYDEDDLPPTHPARNLQTELNNENYDPAPDVDTEEDPYNQEDL